MSRRFLLWALPAVLFPAPVAGALAIGGGLGSASLPSTLDGIPEAALVAYVDASARAGEVAEGCELDWPVLAAVGKVESGHAAGFEVQPDGTIDGRIVGIALDGRNGTAEVPDTDDGVLDGDATWDRAVGPMQFLPGSWAVYGVDGSDDGVADPQNFGDAVLAAVGHLCGSTPADLRQPEPLERALYAYNHDQRYVARVIEWVHVYRAGSTADDPAGGAPVVEAALDHVGKPYLWGGNGPDSFDCSGLTRWAWRAAGVELPRVSVDQFRSGPRVAFDEALPGDLLFWAHDTADPSTIHHVALYIGSGLVVHAPSAGSTVRVQKVWSAGLVGVVRPRAEGAG